MKSRLITLLLLLITVSSVTFAQEAKKEIPLKYGATNEGKRQDPAMQKFRDNRLGAFIHWGLYSIPACGEWVMSEREMTVERKSIWRSCRMAEKLGKSTC